MPRFLTVLSTFVYPSNNSTDRKFLVYLKMSVALMRLIEWAPKRAIHIVNASCQFVVNDLLGDVQGHSKRCHAVLDIFAVSHPRDDRVSEIMKPPVRQVYRSELMVAAVYWR
jgi:hypothetical protein